MSTTFEWKWDSNLGVRLKTHYLTYNRKRCFLLLLNVREIVLSNWNFRRLGRAKWRNNCKGKRGFYSSLMKHWTLCFSYLLRGPSPWMVGIKLLMVNGRRNGTWQASCLSLNKCFVNLVRIWILVGNDGHMAPCLHWEIYYTCCCHLNIFFIGRLWK